MSVHCENCGASNPATDNDGYTTCCNELLCDGRSSYKYATAAGVQVTACCNHTADVKATAAGTEVTYREW